MIVTDGGQPRRIDVPVEVPEGVRFIEEDENSVAKSLSSATARNLRTKRMKSGGVGVGNGGGIGVASAPAPVAASGMVNSTAPQARTELLDDAPPPVDPLRQKMHPLVFAVVERLRKKETLSSADEARFIRNGSAEVQIWLTEKSDAVMAKLKELGFEVVLNAKTSKLIIGRIPIEKLQTLAELKFVTYVSPQLSK
jgi:hypothetical protein